MTVTVWTGHEDKTQSQTDSTYEFYFTNFIPEGGVFELNNAIAIIPAQANDDIAELGYETSSARRALAYKKPGTADYYLHWYGSVLIPSGARFYLKVTGTAVDADVRLEVQGRWEKG